MQDDSEYDETEAREVPRDWFGRDSSFGYTEINKNRKTIDWEQGLDNFSDFFSGGPIRQDKRKKKIELSQVAALVHSMGRVIGLPDGVSYGHQHDQKTIMLPVDLLTDQGQGLSPGQRTDQFMGASLHEIMAHKVFGDDYMDYLAESARVHSGQSPEQAIINAFRKILADQYVDNRIGERTPGYTRFIQKHKSHVFDALSEKEAHAESAGEAPTPIQEFMGLFTRLVRYPENLDAALIEKFEEPLDYVKKLFGYYGGYPKSMDQMKRLSSQLMDYMLDYFTTPPPPPPPPGEPEPEESGEKGEGGPDEGEGEGGGGQGDQGDGEGNEGEGDGQGEGEGEGDQNQQPGGGVGNSGPSESQPSLGNNSPSPTQNNTGPKPPTREELVQQLASAVEQMQQTISPQENIKTDQNAVLRELVAELEDLASEHTSLKNKSIVWEMAKPDELNYKRMLAGIDLRKVSTLRELFKRTTKDYKYIMKSMKSGRLDTNKLAESRCQVPNIYERRGAVKTSKLCVGVVIDESGSMAGGYKVQRATQAAIFLAQCFGKQADVELFIYGHTADSNYEQNTEMFVYYEPGHKRLENLGSIRARQINRDGTAIKAVADRIRTMTANPGVLLVISDGLPSAYDSRQQGIEHTRKMVLAAEKLGFDVIQIAIDSVDSAQMFKKFLHMQKIETLPEDLTMFLRKNLNKMRKEVNTLC